MNSKDTEENNSSVQNENPEDNKDLYVSREDTDMTAEIADNAEATSSDEEEAALLSKLETLNPDEDIQTLREFLKSQSNPLIKRLALRKLFSAKKFNVRDGLNDYDLDYSKMKPLGNIITSDMASLSTPEKSRAKLAADRQQIAEQKNQPSAAAQVSNKQSYSLNFDDAENLDAVNDDAVGQLFHFAAPEKEIRFHSAGRLMIIAATLPSLLDLVEPFLNYKHPVSLFVADAGGMTLPSGVILLSNNAKLKGSFTHYKLENNAEHYSADMVIDFTLPGLMRQRPEGYFTRADIEGREDGFTFLKELVEQRTGEFSAPAYVEINHSICAFGKGFLDGCDLCLQNCEYEAIEVVNNKISINYDLCNGSGHCAQSCPSAAMTYQYPTQNALLQHIRLALRNHLDAQESTEQKYAPTVIFVQQEKHPKIQSDSERLYVPLDETGHIDTAVLLLTLCYGAGNVVIENDKHASDVSQFELANHLLETFGYGKRVWQAEQTETLVSDKDFVRMNKQALLDKPLNIVSTGTKRDNLFLAIDTLSAAAQSGLENEDVVIAVPDFAPMGEVSIQTDGCTLCLSCTSVCPAQALQAGGDTLMLKFKEQNCLQCGLCESACPENVISLHPQLQLNKRKRNEYRILHEEAAVNCLRCGQPFASAKMLKEIESKIKDHPMFTDPAARRRLHMCADCRVKDMME